MAVRVHFTNMGESHNPPEYELVGKRTNKKKSIRYSFLENMLMADSPGTEVKTKQKTEMKTKKQKKNNHFLHWLHYYTILRCIYVFHQALFLISLHNDTLR